MPEGPDRAVANIMSRADVLDEWQRATIGNGAQLRLPLRDKMDLRRLSVILRTLANRAEVISSRRDNDDFSALLEFKAAVMAAQGQASSRPLRGR